MRLKKIFEFFIYAFVIVVPIFPYVKIVCHGYVPLSADLVLSIGVITCGALYTIKNYKSLKYEIYFFNDMRFKIFFVIIAVYVTLGFLSATYAKNKFLAVSDTFGFLEYVFLFYFIMVLADKRVIKNCFYLLYATMIIVSIYGLIQFGCDLSRFYDKGVPFHRGRIYATFVNPNYWGAAINIVIYYPFLKILQKNNKHRWKDILAFSLLFVNLILTYTRGSWLGFIIGVAILAVIYYKKIIWLLIVGIASVFAVPELKNRFMTTFDMNWWTNKERFILWKTGYMMFKEHIFTGVGNGNYLDMYKVYVKKYPKLLLSKTYTAHNSYIKTLAELGIFGGVLFTAIYGYIGYLAYICCKRIKDKEWKIIAVSFMAFWGAYMFQNFFNTLIFIPQINSLVWVLFALIFKYSYLEEKD